MLKSIYEKWIELKEKNIDINENYIAAFYLGKESITNLYLSINKNKMRIYIEFTKEVLESLDVPQVKGMKVEIQQAKFINENKKYICIENESNNEAIFIAFSSSLADELMNTKTYFDVYQKFIKIVKEYKEYFSNPNFRLSKSEEQGLCAELIELEKLIDVKGESVILTWQGPSKNKRDFVFKKTALEVKSTFSQMNSSITISNENQLDITYPTNLDKLFLSIYIMEDSNEGIDIITCINNILNKISSINLIENFKVSLLKMKIDLDCYETKNKFSIQSNKYYLVTSDFPKLTKHDISSEIYNISYKLRLDNLEEFIISNGEVYEQL